MLLRKAQGGCTITYQGADYTWGNDGDVVEVPYEFGMQLLGIRGGDYTVASDEPAADPDDSQGDDGKVTEPDPAGKVTEPDPGTGADPGAGAPADTGAGAGEAKTTTSRGRGRGTTKAGGKTGSPVTE